MCSPCQRSSPRAPLASRGLLPGPSTPTAPRERWQGHRSHILGRGEYQSIPWLCHWQRGQGTGRGGGCAVPPAVPRREERAGCRAHMMVQEDSGFRMWQVQAAPQYWRKVW